MSRNERQPGGSRAKGLTRQQKQFLLLAAGVILLVAAVIGITVAVFFSKNPQKDPPVETVDSISSESVNSADLVEDTEYDPTKDVLDVEKYSATILPLTEDAGEDYIDGTYFVGDSNTYRYMSYSHTTLNNTIGVVGMGIQDVLTSKLVKFVGYSDRVTIPEALAIVQPRRIVISVGTNNANGDWSAEYMAEQYAAMLDGIEAKWPYADIIIAAIPPVARVRDGYQNISMSVIDKYNTALAALAEERGCKFLNISETLKDPETGFAKDGYTVSDGIHLNQKAVDAIFEYLRTHALTGTEDRRPMPLKKIPKRDEPTPPTVDDKAGYTGTVPGSMSSKEGLEIVFAVNDAKMGTLEGEVEQIVPAGEKCTEVVAVPKEGYSFAYWSCSVGRIDDVKTEKLVFVSPSGFDTDKVVVTANFVKSGYLVSVKSSDAAVGTAGIRDGSELLKECNVEEGKSIQLYASLNAGYGEQYKFAGWRIKDKDNNVVTLSTELEYTYTPTGSVEITAVFEPKYSITVKTDGTGGCSVTGQESAGKYIVEAKAAAGYVFDYWTINNGTPQYGEARLEFNLAGITENLSVVAHFKAEGGSSSGSSSGSGSSGSGNSASDSSSSGSSAHSHVWASSWSSDGTAHWHECTVAGCPVTDNTQKDGYSAHSYTGANCITPGSCICGAAGSVDAAVHTGRTETVNASDSYTGDVICSDCGATITAGTAITPPPADPGAGASDEDDSGEG